MPLPPSVAEQIKLQSTLLKHISFLVDITFESYDQIETRCYISKYTMQRYLNGKRPFDIYSIAKICVGARLTVQKTEELFKIYGHPLDVDAYRFDAILINAINNKCRIIDFYNTCKEYGFEAMWWEWDRYSN